MKAAAVPTFAARKISNKTHCIIPNPKDKIEGQVDISKCQNNDSAKHTSQ